MHYPTRRSFLRTAGLASAAATLPAQQSPGKYNVLFIAIDDLKPNLGCYGDPLAVTPNMDRLAAQGLLFTRAYCQQAVCSPSRTSLLLGRRPDTTTIYDLEHHFRGATPDVTTLPQHFKNNGYVTASLSKIWHGGLEDGRSNTIPHWTPNSPGAWGSIENALAQTRREAAVIAGGWRADTAAQRERRTGQATVRGPVWASRDVADNQMPDGKTAEMAVEAIGKLKNERFFLMTGFLRPHLPFVAPKRFFDMHPREKFSLAAFREKPAGTPAFAMHDNGELRSYDITPKQGPIPEDLQLDLIRAYYASASYTDACIGKLLDALEANNIRQKTVVFLWGDHGWHLGDHGLWHKHTNFEQATRAPLMISVPGQKNAGRKSAALTEFVDIYPSLTEICGLPQPKDILEGVSFAPLIENPDRSWKSAAFSQYPRQAPEHGPMMGYSMRTDRYRLTLWLTRKDGREVAAELFDYEKDPLEKANLAASPEYASVLKNLRAQFAKGWQAARPAK